MEPNTHVNTGVDLEFVVREEIVEVGDDIFVDAEINTVKNMVSLEDAGRVVIKLEHFFKQLICQCTVPLQLAKNWICAQWCHRIICCNSMST